jgi:hypothetical protein
MVWFSRNKLIHGNLVLDAITLATQIKNLSLEHLSFLLSSLGIPYRKCLQDKLLHSHQRGVLNAGSHLP